MSAGGGLAGTGFLSGGIMKWLKSNMHYLLFSISIVFWAGAYHNGYKTVKAEVQEIKEDYVRKDIWEVHLENIKESLAEIKEMLKKQNGGN